KDKKDDVKGLLFGSSITSIITGITEPIEFTVLFASPFLFYGVHSVLSGLSVVMVEWLNAGVVLTFSGGIIDFIIYGILPWNDRTNWMSLVLPIIIWAILYYAIFRFSIEKFSLKTPGTEEDGDVELRTKDEYREAHGIGHSADISGLSEEDKTSYQITQGLGGSNNIDSFTNCATRLRVTVKDGEKVNESLLRKTGAAGVMASGESVQVIYGTKVEGIAGDLNDFLKQNPDVGNETATQTVTESEAEPVDTIEDSSNEVVEMNGEIVVSPMIGKIVPLENV